MIEQGEGVPQGEEPGDGTGPRLARAAHREPYSTLAVVATTAALAVVPVLSVAGHRRSAVVWLGLLVLILTGVRSRRPEGTWIAARGRVFDVVFGGALGIGLLVLSYYAALPRAI